MHFLFHHVNPSPASHRRRQACSWEHNCVQRAERNDAHPGGRASAKGEALPRVLARNPAVGPGQERQGGGRGEAMGKLPSKGAGRSGGPAPQPPRGGSAHPLPPTADTGAARRGALTKESTQTMTG